MSRQHTAAGQQVVDLISRALGHVGPGLPPQVSQLLQQLATITSGFTAQPVVKQLLEQMEKMHGLVDLLGKCYYPHELPALHLDGQAGGVPHADFAKHCRSDQDAFCYALFTHTLGFGFFGGSVDGPLQFIVGVAGCAGTPLLRVSLKDVIDAHGEVMALLLLFMNYWQLTGGEADRAHLIDFGKKPNCVLTKAYIDANEMDHLLLNKSYLTRTEEPVPGSKALAWLGCDLGEPYYELRWQEQQLGQLGEAPMLQVDTVTSESVPWVRARRQPKRLRQDECDEILSAAKELGKRANTYKSRDGILELPPPQLPQGIEGSPELRPLLRTATGLFDQLRSVPRVDLCAVQTRVQSAAARLADLLAQVQQAATQLQQAVEEAGRDMAHEETFAALASDYARAVAAFYSQCAAEVSKRV